MNDHFYTALVAALGDPGAGTVFHESSGRIWAFRKRNTTFRKETRSFIIATLTIKGKLIENRDGTMSQH